MTQNVTRLYFKACLKCGGDMYLDRDVYGTFQKCLQCGRIVDLEVSPTFARKPEGGKLAA